MFIFSFNVRFLLYQYQNTVFRDVFVSKPNKNMRSEKSPEMMVPRLPPKREKSTVSTKLCRKKMLTDIEWEKIINRVPYEKACQKCTVQKCFHNTVEKGVWKGTVWKCLSNMITLSCFPGNRQIHGVRKVMQRNHRQNYTSIPHEISAHFKAEMQLWKGNDSRNWTKLSTLNNAAQITVEWRLPENSSIEMLVKKQS